MKVLAKLTDGRSIVISGLKFHKEDHYIEHDGHMGIDCSEVRNVQPAIYGFIGELTYWDVTDKCFKELHPNDVKCAEAAITVYDRNGSNEQKPWIKQYKKSITYHIDYSDTVDWSCLEKAIF